MQQFVVPQFIDVEPKIIGAITLRQFLICIVGIGIMYMAYAFTDTALFIFVSLIIVMTFGPLAFMKVNGMPLHFFLINFIQTLKRPKIRVWNKNLTTSEVAATMKRNRVVVKSKEIIQSKPRLAQNSLRDLALIVDTGGIYKGDEL